MTDPTVKTVEDFAATALEAATRLRDERDAALERVREVEAERDAWSERAQEALQSVQDGSDTIASLNAVIEDLASERARREKAEAALADAFEGLQEMLPYVNKYFRQKWELDGYVDRAKAALNPFNSSKSSDPAQPEPRPSDAERIYPCDGCGKMRTKAEGGTVFTVCDTCWDLRRKDGER